MMLRGNLTFLGVSLLLAIGCISSVAVGGEVVVVDPINMGNWVVYQRDAVNGGTRYEFANLAPMGSVIGIGAFYAKTGVGGWVGATTSGQIWLGTDQFAGVRLADITKLEYSTYTYVCGSAPWPSGNDYVRQPIQLQIAVSLGPGGGWAYLMHRPWGRIGASDANPSLHMDRWETWNALDPNAVWYVAYSDSSGICCSWADILAAHPDAVIATPPFNAEPWKWRPPSTCTGFSLNFEVGARKRANAYVFCENPYNLWWKESENFRGYVDKFVIEAIDNSNPQNPVVIVPETTFDFEGAEPVTRTVFMSNKSAWDTPVSLHRDDDYMFKFSFVRMFGRVLYDGWDLSSGTFFVDDGSNQPVKVVARGAYAAPGDYIIAKGTLKQVLWAEEDPPINERVLSCWPEDVYLVFP
ncbi:MAG: hypothetical protein ACUVRS_06835 [Armatimonadota bacterium]